MLSMTGFAVGEAPLGKGRVVLEIRSLNHRFLEVRVHVPPELSDQGFFLEQLAKEKLERGRYDIGVRLEGAALPTPQIDLSRARGVYRALLELRDELAPGTEVTLASVLSVPDLLSHAPVTHTAEVQSSLSTALRCAMERLGKMRHAEGQTLQREIACHLQHARDCRNVIAQRAESLVGVYRARLRERLGRLLADTGVPLDTGRLETEVAILADRSDIVEELARLSCHFDQFERLMELAEPVGRRLDFLLQEIAREANTVGAKSQDAELAHRVVELKAETERMREQVQNVQ